MITNRMCIAQEEVQEQGFLSNPTWGVIRKVQLLRGVLWETWDTLVPPMCLNCPSSSREQCQGHPAPVWLAAPPPGTGPGRLWGTSQEEACRQSGTHNSWIFAARWASIMHCIKIQMLEHEAGNSKKQHEQSKCQRNEKYVQNCDRPLVFFSRNIINRLSLKISNTWEEITKIFKDTIFVFWMLIWHKGVCMRECL